MSSRMIVLLDGVETEVDAEFSNNEACATRGAAIDIRLEPVLEGNWIECTSNYSRYREFVRGLKEPDCDGL